MGSKTAAVAAALNHLVVSTSSRKERKVSQLTEKEREREFRQVLVSICIIFYVGWLLLVVVQTCALC